MSRLAFVASIIVVGFATTASPAWALPKASHAYGLNGTYADELGGVPLTPKGGTIGSTGYTFAAGKGLVLSGGVGLTTYSIEMRFKINSVTSSRNSYVKLIDWLGGTVDSGLYSRSGYVTFYPLAQATTANLVAGRYADIVVTRNGNDKKVKIYLNGRLQVTFVDNSNLAALTASRKFVRFLLDDAATLGGEAAAGAIDHIRIFASVLSQKDAQDLSNGIKPPNVRQD